MYGPQSTCIKMMYLIIIIYCYYYTVVGLTVEGEKEEQKG